MLTIGSPLVVTPAADLPRIAKERGTRLVIINGDPTPLDAIAVATLRCPIGEILATMTAALANP